MEPQDRDNLYREVILDHGKHPRNFRPISDATGAAVGHNRLCGDKLRLFVKLADGVIADVSFQGAGCAISTASASMMTEVVRGLTIEDALAVFRRLHDVVAGDGPAAATADDPATPDLGKLVVFAGVRRFPERVKCATLPWHTLEAALKNSRTPVSTE